MGDYFKPLKRTIGVVTLVLGCVFMAGWIRSSIRMTNFIFPTGQHLIHLVASDRGQLIWAIMREIKPDQDSVFQRFAKAPEKVLFVVPNVISGDENIQNMS